MKTLKYILPFFVFALFSCDTDDDGFYNRIYIDAADLVTIDTEDEYNTGDILFVNGVIPRFIDEPGESTPLDLRRTTGNAPSFTFSFVLEKSDNGVWEPVDLTGNIVEQEGNAFAGSFVQADAEYNGELEEYRFRGGIELEQPGNYRLSFGYNSTSPDIVEMISNSANNNIRVNINSTVSALSTEGFYNFTVN